MHIKTDLLRVEAYPSICPRWVQLYETHVSWVFLMDHDVFKVKKPVDLGFLDFRTLEQRKGACETEVKLNSRLAPHVYRGVVPVRLTSDGRCAIADQGAIVDWAVHMVRLRDSERADHLLRAGELSRTAVESIANRIASFHASVTSDRETARFGTSEIIAQNVEENFAQTKSSISEYLSEKEIDELRRWQTSFLRGHEALLRKRISDGRVRDGHGDLRLEHVYFDNTGPTIIDCIEFCDRFRFGDTCADIAFLSMDLAGQGRVDLAELLLATYARASNDFDLYGVVDFYESYRAHVRGKIALFTAQAPEVDTETKKRAAAEARKYFLLALSSDRRSLLLPAVVAVGGLVASGKSTIAELLGAEMSAPVVDADRTRKSMLGVDPTAPVNEAPFQGAYDPKVTDAVYAELSRRAGVVLDSGRPVVLDASFRSPSLRKLARDLAISHNVPFRFVECCVDPTVCRTRLAERAKARGVSDGREEIFDAFRASYEPASELLSSEHISIDTSLPIEATLATLRSELDTWPRGFVT